jgi:hypothetical protein
MTDMTHKWFAFRNYNAETLYAWGDAAEADKIADIFNGKGELDS